MIIATTRVRASGGINIQSRTGFSSDLEMVTSRRSAQSILFILLRIIITKICPLFILMRIKCRLISTLTRLQQQAYRVNCNESVFVYRLLEGKFISLCEHTERRDGKKREKGQN